MKYWAAHNIYKKIQLSIQQKLKTSQPNVPGNPENIAKSQAIRDFAILEKQHKESEPTLIDVKTDPAVRKWKAVYKLGEQLNRFLDAYSESALWVLPIDAMEIAFTRSLDTVSCINQ